MDKRLRNWILREKALWASHEIFKRGLKLKPPKDLGAIKTKDGKVINY